MATSIRAVIVGACCAVWLSACAPNPPAMYKLADPRDRLICKNEAPLGSNIPQRRCYTLRELDAQSESVRRQMNTAGKMSNKGRIQRCNNC